MEPDIRHDDENAMEDVLAAVRALARGLDRYRHSVGTRLSLGMPELVTLGQLLYDEPMRAAEVGACTGLSPGSVTALLDRLENRGYLTRTRPPENKRTVAIALTDAGRQLARGMYGPMEPLLRQAASEPGAPEPARLAHCLARIAEALDDLADTARPV